MGNGNYTWAEQNAPTVPKHCRRYCWPQGFHLLAILPFHPQAVLYLAAHHKDPFDRLMIAQAHYESLQVVTYDCVF
jgi:PIN domain nuclease of toxin-antitoxin system